MRRSPTLPFDFESGLEGAQMDTREEGLDSATACRAQGVVQQNLSGAVSGTDDLAASTEGLGCEADTGDQLMSTKKKRKLSQATDSGTPGNRMSDPPAEDDMVQELPPKMPQEPFHSPHVYEGSSALNSDLESGQPSENVRSTERRRSRSFPSDKSTSDRTHTPRLASSPCSNIPNARVDD